MPQQLRGFPWSEYADGLRVGVRNNSTAYGYSILATVTFAALSSAEGSAAALHLFLFVIGGGLGFALVELVASHGFRDRMRGERSEVVLLGSAMDVLSICVALGAVLGFTALATGWLAWFGGPLVATVVYLVVNGLEMAFARAADRSRQGS